MSLSYSTRRQAKHFNFSVPFASSNSRHSLFSSSKINGVNNNNEIILYLQFFSLKAVFLLLFFYTSRMLERASFTEFSLRQRFPFVRKMIKKKTFSSFDTVRLRKFVRIQKRKGKIGPRGVDKPLWPQSLY